MSKTKIFLQNRNRPKLFRRILFTLSSQVSPFFSKNFAAGRIAFFAGYVKNNLSQTDFFKHSNLPERGITI
ncbi:hypothetical protein B4098_2018 [Heyndrickxia coagulans]|uniref:Uncharacterized protein n=1 Tax=Heyndrickxia coagulans TaxID=1398 RepID=A0A150JW13_HEYCO|nr:hypothetical protein BCO26_1003 [Heyndrickxia coagulans 2-6]KYC61463.1 hypothetical protein B4098_2018 [Heyndrickxia coagulans]